MRFAAPISVREAPLARRNPVAKLAAVTVVSLALVVTVDPVTPAVTLAVELATLPWWGVSWRVLARRTWPLLASALAVAVVQVLFTTDRAAVASIATGLALRILAVALPGVLVFATTDPTELADALVQQARVPARFAIGALAGFRLLPLLAEEWELLTLARRARGVDAGHNPLAAARLFAGTTFALLVGAIRRGTRLAVAMDARGFAGAHPRTYARRIRFTAADAALVAGGVLTAALALAASVAAGTFRPLL